MFDKILIANRGEIACRVIRTARRMGIGTVAVYSEADADALHVSLADEAYPIGPAAARESYLSIPKLVEVARRSGAQAIHPGYGFLSENADFAEAVAAAGLTFIGPPPAAIRAMGSKAAAKALMEKAGVPLVPGYHGDDQDDALLSREAERIGYPVLLKASAGGGGKGMRIVETATDFSAALASARRESKAAFGDDRMLIERYLTRPRHIEIQVFADTLGNAVHLFERDCSIQRRHQKVIEEAPAPGLDPDRRRTMGEAAVAAARAVGYLGAGTVEFIVQDGDFHFMEMNTRLQVEHPVTEMITGQDLVEWQLRVAAGERLPLLQDDLAIAGHAVEARLYAEDPERGFLPATGVLHRLDVPEGPGIRVETGVRQGDAVSIYYDPLIAKLVAFGEDRPMALRRLRAALAGYRIAGITTNRDFLLRLVGQAAFAAGPADTGFIERHREELILPPEPAPDRVLALACLAVMRDHLQEARDGAAATADPHSPWAMRDGWRLNGTSRQEIRLRNGEAERLVVVQYGQSIHRLEIDGRQILARLVEDRDGALRVELDGLQLEAGVFRRGSELTLWVGEATWRLQIVDTLAPKASAAVSGGRVVAPMPGRIVQVHTKAGAAVKRGQPLLVLEAMKMEHVIVAPTDGVVEALRHQLGDLVEEGAELIGFRVKE